MSVLDLLPLSWNLSFRLYAVHLHVVHIAGSLHEGVLVEMCGLDHLGDVQFLYGNDVPMVYADSRWQRMGYLKKSYFHVFSLLISYQ